MNTFLLQLFKMSVQAGFVILVILMVRAIFLMCKVPKRFVYILWLIPFLRLLCPWTPESSLSILPTQTDIEKIIASHTDEGQTGLVDNLPDTQGLPTWQNVMTTWHSEIQNDGVNHTFDKNNGVVQAESKTEFSIADMVGVIWAVGMISLVIYSFFSYVRLKQCLIGNIHIRDNIYQADYIDTPFVLGIVKPVIYLPSSIEEHDLDYVIAHEQIHIRRRDYLIKIAAFLVTCVHWFNPFVWIAFLGMGKDMEMSCDESVLRKLGEDCKGEYATALLELTSGYRRFSGVPLAFGEGNTKGRIKNIMKYKKSVAVVGIIAIVAIVGLAIMLLTNPKNDTDNEEKKEVIANGEMKEYVMEGVYEMVATSEMDPLYIPNLTIYEEGQFSFSDNPLSSYRAFGDNKMEEINIIAPNVTEDTEVGTMCPNLDYVGEDTIVFHAYFGLFVYSIKEQKIICSVDVAAIGCGGTEQGESVLEVLVTEDGSTIYFYAMNEEDVYILDVEDNRLFKQKYSDSVLPGLADYESWTEYLEGKNMFYKQQPLYEYVEECIAAGSMDESVLNSGNWLSTMCVPMEIDGRKTCAYMELEPYKIVDLYYVVDGVRMKVFGE